jgi:IS1 family transposase
VVERDEMMLQTMLDNSPQAVWYYSDLFATYKALLYTPGTHTAIPDKSETYRVEGVNAELRHYLARLRRKTRCFSKCLHALIHSLKLFVYAWNRRQLHKRKFPDYPAPLIHFVHPGDSPLPCPIRSDFSPDIGFRFSGVTYDLSIR